MLKEKNNDTGSYPGRMIVDKAKFNKSIANHLNIFL